jgi:hypothetical protein
MVFNVSSSSPVICGVGIPNNNNNNNLNHYHKGLSAREFLPTTGFIGLSEPSLIPCVFVSPMKVDCYKAIEKDFVL